MQEFLISLLGGSFSGAAVVAFLAKVFVQNQLDKGQREFQHDLDKKKFEAEADLSVFAESKKEHVVSYRQKKISALEAVYSAVVSTSLPRHEFRKKPTTRNFTGDVEERETGKYFRLFSENFKAFQRAFDSVSSAYAKLEDNALYMESKLEQRVADTLQNINAFYVRKHSEMLVGYEQAMNQFDQKRIPKEYRTFDFLAFHASILQEWNAETREIRQEVKRELRTLLQPET